MIDMQTLRAQQLDARKAKDGVRAGLLTTLVSEAAMVGKNAAPPRETTPEELMLVIRQFLKNAETTYSRIMETDRAGEAAAVAAEVEILKSYLPRQMSEDDIRTAVAGFRAGRPDATMGDVMAHLKATYPGLYDGRTASLVAKQALA